jgi:predicted O-methyltransferase YrrM
MGDSTFDGRELDEFEGMISPAEAELLHRFAAGLGAGCIVEIGSWRGKSAIALARGAAQKPLHQRPMVYCVEPHSSFKGVYGGVFGPTDRAAFYEVMLRSGCSESVALVNLPSVSAAQAWPHPIGFLFIDGDHTEGAVADDVAAWERHVVDGGFIAFDDALDAEIGPSRVIARLLQSGRYRTAETAGKIVVLHKLPDTEVQERWRVVSEATSDLKTRAELSGYAPEFAIGRLAYGSFVSVPRRYMYVETPKAACTSWKRLVAQIEQVPIDARARPYHRESRLDMLIHQRRDVGIPTILDVGSGARTAILTGSADWHVFALSRNPYSRIVSVFENKIRLGEPGYRELNKRFGDDAGYKNTRDAFSAFVQEVVASAQCRQTDAHLRAQSELLLLGLFPYTRIFQMEQMLEPLEALRTHLSQSGYSMSIELELRNESDSRPWRSYFDEATAAVVAGAYAADFSVFSYDPDDWFGPPADFSETQSEKRLRAEIVARNAMIDRLYDFLS